LYDSKELLIFRHEQNHKRNQTNMKMGPGLFWGILFLLIGISLLIKVVFRLDVPVVRIVTGLVLILLGVRMLVGGPWFFREEPEENEVIFAEKTYRGKEVKNQEYSVVFGKATFDFTDLDSLSLPKHVKISTVFGSTTIFLSREVPVKIKGESVFAGVRLPGGSTAVFGSTSYESEGFDPARPYLGIQSEVVFGRVNMVYRE